MVRSSLRTTFIASFALLVSAVAAQPALSELSVVEFDDAALGTIVASHNGILHIVRVITRRADADTPLMEEASIRFPKRGSAKATLVRRVEVDDRYLMGLYRCGYTASYAEHSLTTEKPTAGQELYMALDKRPSFEPVFEPETRGRITFARAYLGLWELDVTNSSLGLASSPVYSENGTLVAITADDWKRSEDRAVVNMLPIGRVRELILGGAGTGNGPNGIPCEQFNLREAASGRNTCEEQEHRRAVDEQARLAKEEAHSQEVARYNAQRKELKQYERRMEQSPFAWAPFIGLGVGGDFSCKPLGGVDLFLMPDRFFQIQVKLQGGLLRGERNYADSVSGKLGFDRIRTRSEFVEGLAGFCLGKGDFFFAALGGYGMETPATVNRSMGEVDHTVTSTTNWLRPVSQFDLGVQMGHVRVLVGFRSTYGPVADAYKAQNLALPSAMFRPAEDLKASDTMFVFEFSYRIRGWWSVDSKDAARKEYNAGGGLPKPQ